MSISSTNSTGLIESEIIQNFNSLKETHSSMKKSINEIVEKNIKAHPIHSKAVDIIFKLGLVLAAASIVGTFAFSAICLPVGLCSLLIAFFCFAVRETKYAKQTDIIDRKYEKIDKGFLNSNFPDYNHRNISDVQRNLRQL